MIVMDKILVIRGARVLPSPDGGHIERRDEMWIDSHTPLPTLDAGRPLAAFTSPEGTTEEHRLAWLVPTCRAAPRYVRRETVLARTRRRPPGWFHAPRRTTAPDGANHAVRGVEGNLEVTDLK
jgi:hypothetical protein